MSQRGEELKLFWRRMMSQRGQMVAEVRIGGLVMDGELDNNTLNPWPGCLPPTKSTRGPLARTSELWNPRAWLKSLCANPETREFLESAAYSGFNVYLVTGLGLMVDEKSSESFLLYRPINFEFSSTEAVGDGYRGTGLVWQLRGSQDILVSTLAEEDAKVKFGEAPTVEPIANYEQPNFAGSGEATLFTRERYKISAHFSDGQVCHPRGRGQLNIQDASGAGDLESWARVKSLGEGGQGIVYLEKSDTGQLRAVKKIPQRLMKDNGQDIDRELHALIEVRDRSDLFVNFLGWYEDYQMEYVYIAMEYIPHGDLGQYLKINGVEALKQARIITKQIVTGITVLHQKNICHRDLKPQNILIAKLSPIQVKLADFGVSKTTEGTQLRTRHGTTNYMAPEVLGILPRKLRRGHEYTNAVDMWALGCIVHEILTLSFPFHDNPSETDLSGVCSTVCPPEVDTYVLSEFCKGNLELPIESLVHAKAPEIAIQFIQKLLVADPRYRMSAGDALNQLWLAEPQPAHPWSIAPSASSLLTSQTSWATRTN